MTNLNLAIYTICNRFTYPQKKKKISENGIKRYILNISPNVRQRKEDPHNRAANLRHASLMN